MRFKDYIWPNNPHSCRVEYRRPCAVFALPLGGWAVQELGTPARVIRGEGVFYGPQAYERFRELEEVFRLGGAGLLVHPAWPALNACFTELQLEEQPMEDYIGYSFGFCEQPDNESASDKQSSEEWYELREGETFWSVAEKTGIAPETLLSRNPQLPSPNDLVPGMRVRLW